jgi:hypothetical protein
MSLAIIVRFVKDTGIREEFLLFVIQVQQRQQQNLAVYF